MANLTKEFHRGRRGREPWALQDSALPGARASKRRRKSPLSSTGPDNLVWDEEYDVVVAGFGGAGGAAAIEAFDNGASVLVLDSDAMPGAQHPSTEALSNAQALRYRKPPASRTT